MTLTIFSVLPELFNVNGDAENARVLAVRAQWAGIPSEVVAFPPEHPDLVVLGSGFDADFVETAEAVHRYGKALRRFAARGIPILAIGTGFEILCHRVRLSDNQEIDGLALLPGEVIPGDARMNGDLIGVSSFGMLIGYENHARKYLLPDPSMALATVVHGHGNGDDGTEGVIYGSIIGSHLHGPILAKNPALADHLLALATGGAYRPLNASSKAADVQAYQAREQIMKRTHTGRRIKGRRQRTKTSKSARRWT